LTLDKYEKGLLALVHRHRRSGASLFNYTHGESLAIYGGDEGNNFKYLMFLFF